MCGGCEARGEENHGLAALVRFHAQQANDARAEMERTRESLHAGRWDVLNAVVDWAASRGPGSVPRPPGFTDLVDRAVGRAECFERLSREPSRGVAACCGWVFVSGVLVYGTGVVRWAWEF